MRYALKQSNLLDVYFSIVTIFSIIKLFFNLGDIFQIRSRVEQTVLLGQTMKPDIILETGEYNLLLPQLIGKGLLSVDICRYFLNLLIFAIDHADNPDIEKDSLADFRISVGIKNNEYDRVISDSSLSCEGIYQIPCFEMIRAELSQAIRSMVMPFREGTIYADPTIVERAEVIISLICEHGENLTIEDPRIGLLHEGCTDDNCIMLIRTVETILVPIREKLIPEDVYGATVYLAEPEDVYLIRSFMIGLNQTESLRCEHPGLGTTVIRAGSSLLIMNEIGITDNNFLVLNVKGLNITITYVDPHILRISFFQSMMKPYPVIWKEIISKSRSGKNQFRHIHHATGSFSARSQDEVMMFFSHLSSHIVFLIEWNRARKALKPFLSGNDSVTVLQKAAKRKVGHRGFIIAGGERLISEVLDSVPEVSIKDGETLSDLLGSEDGIEFCISVLEITNRYISQNLSRVNLQEDIRSELVRQYSATNEDMYRIFIRYAESVKNITVLFTEFLSVIPGSEITRRNEIEIRIQKHVAELDSCAKRLWGKNSRRHQERSWETCFFQIHKAVELLGEAGYLCTLIPVGSITHEIGHELTQLSEYVEYVAVFLYYSIEGGEGPNSWNTDNPRDLKRYSANINLFIKSSEKILRTAKKTKICLEYIR